jgi:hypothetical protein
MLHRGLGGGETGLDSGSKFREDRDLELRPPESIDSQIILEVRGNFCSEDVLSGASRTLLAQRRRALITKSRARCISIPEFEQRTPAPLPGRT